MLLLYIAFFVSLAALIVSIALFFTVQNRLPKPATASPDTFAQNTAVIVQEAPVSDRVPDTFADPVRPETGTIVSGDIIPGSGDALFPDAGGRGG